MSLVKYRLREVAADFGVAPKEIAEIVGAYFEKPKSNTQVLTEEELNVVFDRMTAKNQISSLESAASAGLITEAEKLDLPEENAKAFTPDGFMRTGDIGVMDEEGYTRIIDRKKDMILVSGFNVFPNELEQVVALCPGVLECAAVGVADENLYKALADKLPPREAVGETQPQSE